MSNKSSYRISLKLSHIERISSLIKLHGNIGDPLDLEILQKLSIYQAKIAAEAITPSHIASSNPKSKPTISQSLGLDPLPETQLEDKEVYWERCYDKLQQEGIENLSVSQIKAAKEHMYLNDLFTPEEKTKYESEMFAAYNSQLGE